MLLFVAVKVLIVSVKVLLVVSNFDCKALDNPVISVCLSVILSYGVQLFDMIFNISFPLTCNELISFIFKAF